MEQFLSRLMQNAAGGEEESAMINQIMSPDPMEKLTGLTRLCDQLNMSSFISPRLVSKMPTLLPPLLNCIQSSPIPEVSITAARALTYLMEVASQRTEALLRSEEVAQVLCGHLRSIEDMELSEQCLACLSKISESPYGAFSILKSNGIDAVLGFADFFTTSTQRRMWEIVLRAVKSLNPAQFSLVEGSLPLFWQATQHSDSVIREKSIHVIQRLIDRVQAESDLVVKVFGNSTELCMSVLMQRDFKDPAFSAVLDLLISASSNSAVLCKAVIHEGIVGALIPLLKSASSARSGAGTLTSPPVSPGLRASSPESTSGPQASPSLLPSSPFGRPRDSPAGFVGEGATVDQRCKVCTILASLLVPCRTGLLSEIDKLDSLLLKPTAAAELANEEEEEEQGDSNANAPTVLAGGDQEQDGARSSSEATSSSYEDVDEEEEDADEGGSVPSLEEVRSSIMASAKDGLNIAAKASYRRFVHKNSHICDGCGKPCAAEDWFRCNDCGDSDFCSRCLLQRWRGHHGGSHSFTDMSTFNECPQWVREKEELYRSEPDLLSTVMDAAVPAVIDVCASSEVAKLRRNCLEFLASCAAMATTQQIEAAGMANASGISEVICNTLNDKGSFSLQLFAVAIVELLLQKSADQFQIQFIREGVLVSLQRLKLRLFSKSRTSWGKEDRRARVKSLHGWKVLAYQEVLCILPLLSNIEDEERASTLKHIKQFFADGKLSEAADALVEVLSADLTSFELQESGILGALHAGLLGSAEPAVTLLKFVHILSRGVDDEEPHNDRRKSTALWKLIHHLHSILTTVVQFDSPINPTVVPPITFALCRFAADEKQLSEGNAEKPAERPSENSSDRSEASGKGNAVTLRVDIHTTMKAIVNYLLSKSLVAQDAPAEQLENEEVAEEEEEEDDDAVSEVLPKLKGVRRCAEESDSEDKEWTQQAMRGTGADSADSPPKTLWVRYGDQVLPQSMTIYQVMRDIVIPALREGGGGRAPTSLGRFPGAFTGNPLSFHYSSVPFSSAYKMHLSAVGAPPAGNPSEEIKLHLPRDDPVPHAVQSVLDHLRHSFMYCGQILSPEEKTILQLLGALHETVAHWGELCQWASKRADVHSLVSSPSATPADFRHEKLNNKAMRHCARTAMAGQQRTTWAVKLALDCNFLFTSVTRRYLFDVSFCEVQRSLLRMERYRGALGMEERNNSSSSLLGGGGNPNAPVLRRMQRLKRRVWRDKIMPCAREIFGKPSSGGSVFCEFEFYGEEGSGLGPTREFYSLLGKKFCEKRLALWRKGDEDDGEKFYLCPAGLYPRLAAPASIGEARLGLYFQMIGRFIGRALLDEHVPALPLSPVIIKMLRGDLCSVYDLEMISSSLGNTIVAIMEAAKRKSSAVQLPGQSKSFPIEDLDLDFSLPGEEAIPLKDGGCECRVTADNMLSYADAVTAFMLRTGVEKSVHALRSGFHEYIPLVALRMLSVEEIYELLAGHESPITREELEAHTRADHGYTLRCLQVQWFFDILISFSLEEQKEFFFFLTGSPHLPVGGLGCLRPTFTIVRKTSTDSGIKESDQLPSVMTCQNYLKLPEYESKEQMEQKLRTAMMEGKGAFLLT